MNLSCTDRPMPPCLLCDSGGRQVFPSRSKSGAWGRSRARVSEPGPGRPLRDGDTAAVAVGEDTAERGVVNEAAG